MKIKSAVIGDMGNNCYLITDEETNKSALIDCTEYTTDMKNLIKDSDLQFILLTHGHFDHICGVYDVAKQTGAKVMISNEDASMLTSSRDSLAAFCGASQKPYNDYETFKDNDIINLGKTKIKVIATPGHTKGSVCFIVEDAIFSGDTLFYCSCGRTDFPGGSLTEIKESLKKLGHLKGEYNVYPGHDRTTTLDFERHNNPYMTL